MVSTTKLQHFTQLDGFRCFAIFAVMLSHFKQESFVSRFPFGYGVMLFFVLSSFLISRILLVEKAKNVQEKRSFKHSFINFYIRRSLRIFPIYYLLIIFFYLLNYSYVREIFPWLFTYTLNFFITSEATLSVSTAFTHIWSLSIEEQFYLFFPFCVFLIKDKYILPFFFFLVFIGLLGRFYLFSISPNDITFANFHTISALDSLGIGAILGYLSLYKMDKLKKIIGKKYIFLTIGLSFLLVMYFSFFSKLGLSKYNFYSIVCMRFLFNMLCFWVLGWSICFGYKGILKKIIENKFVLYLGKISYGLYLYHFFVFYIGTSLLSKFNISLSENITAILFTIISIIMASLSWTIIEKPINKIKDRFQYN